MRFPHIQTVSHVQRWGNETFSGSQNTHKKNKKFLAIGEIKSFYKPVLRWAEQLLVQKVTISFWILSSYFLLTHQAHFENHRTIWARRDLKSDLVPPPTAPACSKSHPTWPGMELPQLPWTPQPVLTPEGWPVAPGATDPSPSPQTGPCLTPRAGKLPPAPAHPRSACPVLPLVYWCLLITSLLWRDTNCSLHTMLVIMPITFWFISICQHYYKGDFGEGGGQSTVL